MLTIVPSLVFLWISLFHHQFMCCTIAVAQASFASAQAQVSSFSDRNDDPDERRDAVDVGVWFTIFAIDQQTLEIHTVDAAAKVCPGIVKGKGFLGL